MSRRGPDGGTRRWRLEIGADGPPTMYRSAAVTPDLASSSPQAVTARMISSRCTSDPFQGRAADEDASATERRRGLDQGAYVQGRRGRRPPEVVQEAGGATGPRRHSESMGRCDVFGDGCQVSIGVRVDCRCLLADPVGNVITVACEPEVVEEIGDGLTQRRALADPVGCLGEGDGAASTRREEGGERRAVHRLVPAPPDSFRWRRHAPIVDHNPS